MIPGHIGFVMRRAELAAKISARGPVEPSKSRRVMAANAASSRG
jgi:hypothetical protein